MDFLDVVRGLTMRRINAMGLSVRVSSMIKAIEDRNSEGYLALIAEYKRASPSGVIRLDLDPWTYFDIVSRYATAFSVLVEPIYFLGSPLFIKVALGYGKPILYKDFVIDERQVRDAKELGASSILLIKRLLGDRLWDFVELAVKEGLEPLIEVDNEDDAIDVVNTNPNIMLGINARDLGNLSVSLDRSISIIRLVRGKADLVIAESGVKDVDDAVKLAREGANAILVGTALMRRPELSRDLANVRL
ncbi:MAG: indole-3-glycerol-phosphate synthase [Vulcanisaeta sp.]|jgi:indole-3-glycerol phosphate synthase|uniref:indole-3-glycerol-phosphate synthase n=1 Tax=Vulcanisaeta sp. EB80 TaxID=1650660 RepID=UPI0009C11DD9|nr:indole-3-glycerol-phosphate synthase [Vulcanisaeta sp. EB80]MCG2866132.1 indole-3-glycerol-phosphate synthase [Vulcanisaeta sp.]MCG2885180.1 indole-3-glycerol-phosphate synthase [Vulcanisaeta sp.]PLC67407.1 indole-3-glycerol phosphate synthase [Vulcanisaeta sp. EB80]